MLVESATHQTLMWAGLCMRDAPGEGEFTLDSDRVWIGRMVTQMVWSKLFYYLEHRQFHNYRYLLNSHAAAYFRALDVEPIDCLIPGFSTEIDPNVDYKGFMLERFLHHNGFRRVETQSVPKPSAPKVAKFITPYRCPRICAPPSGTSSSGTMEGGRPFALRRWATTSWCCKRFLTEGWISTRLRPNPRQISSFPAS